MIIKMDEENSEKKENSNQSKDNNDLKYTSDRKIIPRLIEEEMRQSYLDYAMSVIVGRALPDVRDGLKPVHRRVLYAMYRASLFHNKAYRKSAFIVGRVMSDLHPHGDAAIYDTLVRMAQAFSLRYPLIDGQGNFGSVDGDSQAAMRYTEARLKKIAEELLQDLDKETVKFIPNFDNTLQEPLVLPSKLPNLLINGSSGIAVGMATNIPPHNISEVIDGIIAVIDNPNIAIEDIMHKIKGPDFPTAALILGKKGISNIYKNGRGRIIIRSRTEIEEDKKRIIVTEIPYMVNKAQMIEEIADLVSNKKINGIADLRDESSREGIRVIIELKSGINPEIVLNQLYKHSRLQVSFGVIMLALVDNVPKILNLKQLINYFIVHRKEVVTKRTQFELKKAEERAHILEGLIIALKSIEDVIRLIKKSSSIEIARESLISSYSLTKTQAQAILDMRLQRLTSLEQERIKKEHSELLKLIEELKSILAEEQRILDIIKKELLELKEKYGDERKTEITDIEEELEIEDLIASEDQVITITHAGYIKRLSMNTYKQQRRGGKGVIAAEIREKDFVENVFIANTHSYILFFTDKGKVHWLKVYLIPEAGRQAKGKAIINLLNLEPNEKITAFIPVKEFDSEHYLILATKKGIVKKTNLIAYSNPRKGGIIAINLEQGDELIDVILTNGKQQILLATKKGNAVRFREEDARAIGRSGKGVIGIRLREDDEVIGMVDADDTKTLLTVTENGYGKRTAISEYRLINRGGSGVINIQCSERNGNVVAVKSVTDNDDIIFISRSGIIIRTPAKGISRIGRNTQGVRLMSLEQNDKVVAAARIIKE
jgi:DNA gyrase subunit A